MSIGNQAGNLRIALAQVNPTVGDIEGNADLIATQAALAHKAGAQLLVFPEMVLTGYPVEDLAETEVRRGQVAKAIGFRVFHTGGFI